MDNTDKTKGKIKLFDVAICEITKERMFMVTTKAAIVDDCNRLRRSSRAAKDVNGIIIEWRKLRGKLVLTKGA